MEPTIITALISGLCVAIPTLISVVITSGTRDAIQEEHIKTLTAKIDELSERVALHNSFGTRLAVIESDLKSVYKQLEIVRREHYDK